MARFGRIVSYLRKQLKPLFGTIVALSEGMDGSLLNALSDLVTVLGMDEMVELIVDNVITIPFAAFAFFLIFLTAKSAKGHAGGFFKALMAGDWFQDESAADRMFERRNISAVKTCPGCSEQVPMSVLICEGCDHNFLTGTVGSGQRMLPSPEAQVYEMRPRNYAYRA